jgi:hypothetical protein
MTKYSKARNGTIYHIMRENGKSLCTDKNYGTEMDIVLSPGAKICYNCKQVFDWEIKKGRTPPK